MTLKNIPFILLLLFVAACSSETDNFTEGGTPVNVTLRLSVAGNENTRADELRNPDTYATADEMMKNWTVIVVNSEGNIEKIVTKSNVDNLETDNVSNVSLTAGVKIVYSFANISDIAAGLTEGSTMPDWSTQTYSLYGNDFNPSTSGIPMSNKQEITVSTDGQTVDLIVVRMLAKMEFRFTNVTSAALKITSITLSEITSNAPDNIYLLPSYQTGEGMNGPDDMAAGNLLPNLPTGITKADFTKAVNLVVAPNTQDPVTTAFYLNESQVSDTYPGYFVITLTLDKGEGNTAEQRYALLTWKEIARNDYRIIPITLDDYALDILPYDFPPIGVYPASVKEEDGKFTCTFHAGGHFHIVPTVRRLSDNAKLGYSDEAIEGTDTWTFSSWSSDADATIYEVCPDGETAPTTDASDNGYAPVWDATNHYVFGKLKQDVTGTAYHELQIHVNKGTTAAYRTLTYKLYIIKE